MNFAQSERQDMVRVMREVGPAAHTLCGEWTTRDLAAHLVIRDRRADTLPGIVIPACAGYTEKVRLQYVRSLPWEQLLAQISSGPPWWSPLWPVDALANLGEMFVHHEDVRRGQSAWQPRKITGKLADRLWKLATVVAKKSYRTSTVTVVLETTSGQVSTASSSGDRKVVLRGEPGELLLHAFGRDAVQLDVLGNPADIDLVFGVDRSI
ncbi:MAG: TIGR03085 family metal-binding protein [Mycobacteriaceae bacterium]